MTGFDVLFPNLAAFAKSRRANAEQRKTVRALNELSNQTLKDIGIHRSEIYSVANDVSNTRRC